MPRAALAAVALAACADLPPIPAATCGNGILEPGEDCDVPDARCQSCGWRCGAAPAYDCSDIPAPRDGRAGTYACGADGLCHAPSGVIGDETSAQPFPATSALVTDVDGDGCGDAVGVSTDSIVTRFGDRSGTLATSRSTLTPAFGGAAANVDLDGDGRRDLLAPARDGIVAYSPTAPSKTRSRSRTSECRSATSIRAGAARTTTIARAATASPPPRGSPARPRSRPPRSAPRSINSTSPGPRRCTCCR